MTKDYRIKIRFQGHDYLSAESFITFGDAQKEGGRRFTKTVIRDVSERTKQGTSKAHAMRLSLPLARKNWAYRR